jgi:hexulose-6-phosphate isomerase
MTRIGIMQGRLVPPLNGRIQAFPRDSWADEFARAAAAQLDCIEWIYDAFGADVNPFGSAAGLARLQTLIAESGVTIRSVCADYFMDKPLLRISEPARQERLGVLEHLLEQGRQLGIVRMVLPFVDASAITTAAEADSVVESLLQIIPVAARCGVELHLETALDAPAFQALLAPLPARWVKVNYDIGNSASLGYRPQEEFAAYGDRLGSVHIKDRVRGGSTVPLGSGDADFDAVFNGLRALRYAGDFVLQVARGTAGDEVAWARANRRFVQARWGTDSHGSALR